MEKVWQYIRVIIPVAVIALLLALPCPAMYTNNGATATTPITATTDTQAAPAKTATAKPKATKPRSKSVLDADVLDSPLSYFREAFTSEEDDNSSDGASTAINTVKALVATLLSTVL